jgi:diaminopropionate ammonia-lyase
MRYIVNRFRAPSGQVAPPNREIRDFHRTLPGYEPTPLVRRTALARALGLGDLYVKHEGSRFGLGAFKGLGASWALHRLTRLQPGSFTTVSAASEGNHGRAVAWAARLAGIPCVIYLPSHVAPERVDNIRREGATVVQVDGTYEDAVHRCDFESRERGWQVISDVGYDGYLEIPELVVAGYGTLFEEIDEQLEGAAWPSPDLVLIPAGVGGILHAGVTHYAHRDGGPRVVGVEPSSADCLTTSLESAAGQPTTATGDGATTMACLNCAEVSLSSWPAIRNGVDAMIAIDDETAMEGVRLLYRAAPGDAALEAGNSGAATTGALAALMRDPRLEPLRDRLRLDSTSRVVVVCTEGVIDRAEFARCLAT